jgi:CheY-like chemotaxis protein
MESSITDNHGTNMNRFEKQTFLLVEAREHDVRFVKEAFYNAEIPNPLRVLNGGDEAIAYLAGASPYNDRISHPLPSVLLLDFNLPGKNGFEVIDWVRRQPALKSLVIIALTDSERRADVERAYDLGVNSYLTKPGLFTDFVKSMKSLYGWLRLCHFPHLC